MNFHKYKPVKVVDPDLPQRTLVRAWEQYVDKETGDHMVVIDGEPAALRRIAPDKVFTGPKAV